MSASDERKLLRILREAYTQSMYTGPEGPKLADEFHPDFQILVPELDGRTGEIADVEWIRPALSHRQRGKTVGKKELTFDCRVLDITGKIAVAKVEAHRGDRLVCTDYVLFSRLGREWRVVGKTFHQHAVASQDRL